MDSCRCDKCMNIHTGCPHNENCSTWLHSVVHLKFPTEGGNFRCYTLALELTFQPAMQSRLGILLLISSFHQPFKSPRQDSNLQLLASKAKSLPLSYKGMVPIEGFEPPTQTIGKSRSSSELYRQVWDFEYPPQKFITHGPFS